jgi:hypothetical protein
LHLLTSLAVAVGLLAHAVVEGLLDAAITGGDAGRVGGVVPELLRLDGEQLFVLHPLRRVDSVVIASDGTGSAFGALRGRGRRSVAFDGGIGGGLLVLLVLLRLEGGCIAALEDEAAGLSFLVRVRHGEQGRGRQMRRAAEAGMCTCGCGVVGLESVLFPTSVSKVFIFRSKSSAIL